jgi:DNA-directed RNA polymerase subunit H (RpoH/RPB5)
MTKSTAKMTLLARIDRALRVVQSMMRARGASCTRLDALLAMSDEDRHAELRSLFSQTSPGQQQSLAVPVVDDDDDDHDHNSSIATVVFLLQSRVKGIEVASAVSSVPGPVLLVTAEPLAAATAKALGKPSSAAETFTLAELQYDPSAHELVPLHQVLSAERGAQVLARFGLTDKPHKMPLLLKSDRMARHIGARSGQVVRILRWSPTAVLHECFRVVA